MRGRLKSWSSSFSEASATRRPPSALVYRAPACIASYAWRKRGSITNSRPAMPEPAPARDTVPQAPPDQDRAELDWSVLEKLFNAAMDLEPSERTAFLAEASPDDTGMRDEVLSLVLAYERATGKMENAVRHSAARAAEEQQPAAGDRVGPYQLVRRLGFGGMGAVYLAIRADDQYRKEVAVKFLHFTLATPEMLQRFRGERQILASLEHPNIARLLDGGTTVSGLPYVVMEYVDGQPIDEYCARLSLQRSNCSDRYARRCITRTAAWWCIGTLSPGTFW